MCSRHSMRRTRPFENVLRLVSIARGGGRGVTGRCTWDIGSMPAGGELTGLSILWFKFSSAACNGVLELGGRIRTAVSTTVTGAVLRPDTGSWRRVPVILNPNQHRGQL